MLILTRKADESIIINDNIEVTVISVKGNQVRIGIAAPSDVSIQRKEIQQRILDEGETPNSSENPS